MKRHAAVVVGRYFLGFIKFAESVVNYRVGQKKPSPYAVLFVLLQHLFRCTNNIPCELKFCRAHTEAQTKFVCQKFVWNITTESKYPQHYYVTMAKYKSKRSLTELTDHFLLGNSLQIRFALHPFSWRRSLLTIYRHLWDAYCLWTNCEWRDSDVALHFL